MPNPNIRPLPGPAPFDPNNRDRHQRADGSHDVEAMNAEWAALVAEGKAKRKAAAQAKRRKPRPEPNTDYPWLKPGWKW